MDIWKLIWIVALIGGMAGFAYISFTVIIRGTAEVRSLLKEMTLGDSSMKRLLLLIAFLPLMASTLSAGDPSIKIGGKHSTDNSNVIFRTAGSDNFITPESCSRHHFLSSIRLDKSSSNRKKVNRALWFQGGFGAASTDIHDRNQPSELFLHGEFSVHFRRGHNTMAIGGDVEGVEAWGIKTLWGTYGYSYSRSWLESTLTAGIGLSQWYYQPFMERKIYSPHVPALIIRAQTILHLRQLFGFGLVLTGNVNRESFYLAGGFVFALGVWNW